MILNDLVMRHNCCHCAELVVRWAAPYYEFSEGTISARFELATDSNFIMDQVRILGFPRQIPEGHSERIPSLIVPGPTLTGMEVQTLPSVSIHLCAH